MKRDSKVLVIDLYGCSGIVRIQNNISENSLHFSTLLDIDKYDVISINLSKSANLNYKGIFQINISFQ